MFFSSKLNSKYITLKIHYQHFNIYCNFHTSKSPHSPESIVAVHDTVDKVVHDHEPSGTGGELAEAVEDVDEHGQVVIPGTEVN